jgi:hypothetical protein
MPKIKKSKVAPAIDTNNEDLPNYGHKTPERHIPGNLSQIDEEIGLDDETLDRDMKTRTTPSASSTSLVSPISPTSTQGTHTTSSQTTNQPAQSPPVENDNSEANAKGCGAFFSSIFNRKREQVVPASTQKNKTNLKK